MNNTKQKLSGTYSRGETGVVMDTINIFKNQSGDYVFIEIETEINDKSVMLKAFSIPTDKFREMVTDIL